jgi:hypothetical protein
MGLNGLKACSTLLIQRFSMGLNGLKACSTPLTRLVICYLPWFR